MVQFISYDTIVKLMEDYLPERLKNGKEKEFLRKWSFGYMFWATLPRHEDQWWVCEEHFDKKMNCPEGIEVKRKNIEVVVIGYIPATAHYVLFTYLDTAFPKIIQTYCALHK